MATASTASAAPAPSAVGATHPLAAAAEQDPLGAAAAPEAAGGRTTPTPRSVSGAKGAASARSPDSEAASSVSPQLVRGGADGGASPALGNATHHGWLPLQGPNESSDTLGGAASPQLDSWNGGSRKIGYPYRQKNEEEQEAEAVEQVSAVPGWKRCRALRSCVSW
jgi:hypothetical protein